MEKPKTEIYKKFKPSENGYTKITECEIVIKQGENKVILNQQDLWSLRDLLQASFKST